MSFDSLNLYDPPPADLCLVYSSTFVRIKNNEDDEFHSIDKIREFEHVDATWKDVLAEYLRRGRPLLAN